MNSTPPTQNASIGPFTAILAGSLFFLAWGCGVAPSDAPGISTQNLIRSVPYLDQRSYSKVGECACGPTSQAMLLRYLYPSSNLEGLDVYLGGTQSYSYEAPAKDFARFCDGMRSITEEEADGTRDGAVRYLSQAWGVDAVYIPGLHDGEKQLDSLLAALHAGPVLGHGKNHYYVIVDVDTNGTDSVIDDTFYVNDPYGDGWKNYNGSGQNRELKYKEISISGSSLGFNDGLQLVPHDTEVERQYTVVVDSSHIDGVGYSAVHTFYLDDIQAMMASNPKMPVWMHYYGSLGDWYYPREPGHRARWRPRLAAGGCYEVIVKASGDAASGKATYSLYRDLEDKEMLVTRIVDQHRDQRAWMYESLGTYWLAAGRGASVAASNIGANTNMDLVKFKYRGATCDGAVTNPPCGADGQGCCGWIFGSYCNLGLECNNGTCTKLACGGAGQKCCSSFFGSFCATGFACTDDACQALPKCGNSKCDTSESCSTCPQDCGACPPKCPNGSCEASESCSTCPQDCGACCTAPSYWNPTEISDVDIDATQWNATTKSVMPVAIQMRLEVRELGAGGLELRVCKVGSNLSNNLWVQFWSSATDMQMFSGMLEIDTLQLQCTKWGVLSKTNQFTSGAQLIGKYKVVSPSDVDGNWTDRCEKSSSVADALGSCWWDPTVPVMTRTCR